MTGLPALLALLAATPLLLTVAGIALVRDDGPAHPLRAPSERRPPVVERTVRSLGRPMVPLVLRDWPGRRYRTVARRWLAEAGRADGAAVDDFAETHLGWVVLSGGALLWAVVAGSPRLGLALPVLALVLPPLRLRQAASARQRRIELELPAFLELLAVLLASGLTFRHALARVCARSRGPLVDEMQRLLTQLEFGFTPRDALEDLLHRSSAPTLTRLVATVRQNDELGVPIAMTLSAMAEDVRAEYVVKIRTRAEAAATRAALVLVFLAVPGVLGIVLTVLVSEALGTLQGFVG